MKHCCALPPYLEEYRDQLLAAANEKDLAAARANHMPEGLQDRLALNNDRICRYV